MYYFDANSFDQVAWRNESFSLQRHSRRTLKQEKRREEKRREEKRREEKRREEKGREEKAQKAVEK